MDQDQQWDEAKGDWTNVGQPYSRWQPRQPGEGPIGFKGVEREPTSGELGQWDSRGQFHPLSGGASGPSQAQEANNVEIDQSRNYLTSNGLTRDQILARTQPLDPATGLPNPAYDPGVASMFRTAMQHKVGRDDGYTDFIGRYYPSGRPAASGAGPTALPSTSSASPTPAPGPSSPPPPVPRNTYGQPDASALVPGQLYTVPGANRGPPETWRWDGKNFVQPFPGGPR
jgi:hypothetical protein